MAPSMTADEILKILDTYRGSDTVKDPGHSHGINWVPSNYNPFIADSGYSFERMSGKASDASPSSVPDSLILSYIAGVAAETTYVRNQWHQWYHGLSLSQKYYVDAFRMKWESDQVKANHPQDVGKITPAISTEIVPCAAVPGALIYQVKTNTGTLVANKANLVGEKLVWTPVMADNAAEKQQPETKEQYEERRNKRISDRLAVELSDIAKKKAEDAKAAPEKHWSDHKPWPGAHGSQYMLRF